MKANKVIMRIIQNIIAWLVSLIVLVPLSCDFYKFI